MVQGACQAVFAPPRVGTTELLAPAWHTHVLVGSMLAVTAAGVALPQVAPPSRAAASPLAATYLTLALVNLGLLGFVCRVGLERNILARLFSQRRSGAHGLLVDVAWGAALALAIVGAENLAQWLLGLPESLAAHALMPHSASEKLAWVFLGALIGISEELVYRGYLQRQLAGLSGWLPFGVVAQALLFGIAHGEQGGWAVARFAVYALGLGWVAAARQSLLPCVLGHVAIDLLAGIGS